MLANKFTVLLSLFRMGTSKKIQRSVQCTNERIDWDHLPSVLSYLEGKRAFTSPKTKDMFLQNWHSTERYCQKCHDMGIHIIPWDNALFSHRLNLLPDPPIFLFLKGDVEALAVSQAISVVGSRKVSSFHRNVGMRMAKTCAEQNYVIISGLAQGCDTAAHHGCLQAKGRTVAVLAHGLGAPIYPATNTQLAISIQEAGGCLISEYDIFSPPHKMTFLQRNRIIAALCSAMILLYGTQKSGSASSVSYASSLDKELGYFWSPSLQEDVHSLNSTLWKRGEGTPITNKSELDLFLRRI